MTNLQQYQCQFSLEHEGQTFSTCVLAENKKTAQRRASLDVVIQLYQAGLIAGNKGDIRFQPAPYGNKVNHQKLKSVEFERKYPKVFSKVSFCS